MAEQFYTILTKIGKAKIANAATLGTKVNFNKFQVGDSNGAYYNPTEDQTELKHKVWEGNINNISIDKDNPNWIVMEVLLPSDAGGFMIREAAILDDENNIVAVAKYPETYKPVASQGSSKDLIIRTILEVSNTSSVTLKVDSAVIIATKKDIEVLENKVTNIESQIAYNAVKTITGNESAIPLPSSVDGIINIDLHGDTKNINETLVVSVGEKQGNDKYKIEIVSRGQNLIPNNYINLLNNASIIEGTVSVENSKFKFVASGKDAFTDTILTEGQLPAKLRPLAIDIEGTTTLYYSRVIENLTDGNSNEYCAFYDKNYSTVSFASLVKSGKNGIVKDVIVVPASAKYISFRVGVSSQGQTIFYSNFMLSNIDTKYKPYIEDKIEILTNEPLRGLKNGVRDSVSGDTVTRQVGKIVLNGSEDWTLQTIKSNGWGQFDNSLVFSITGVIDRYKMGYSAIMSSLPVRSVVTANEEGITYQFGTGYSYLAIRILKSKLPTPDLAGFKKWLSENLITVYCELATPTTEKIEKPLILTIFKNGSLIINSGSVAPITSIKYPSNINSRVTTIEDSMGFMVDSLGGAWRTLLILADRELKIKSIPLLTSTDDISKKINQILGAWK